MKKRKTYHRFKTQTFEGNPYSNQVLIGHVFVIFWVTFLISFLFLGSQQLQQCNLLYHSTTQI